METDSFSDPYKGLYEGMRRCALEHLATAGEWEKIATTLYKALLVCRIDPSQNETMLEDALKVYEANVFSGGDGVDTDAQNRTSAV